MASTNRVPRAPLKGSLAKACLFALIVWQLKRHSDFARKSELVAFFELNPFDLENHMLTIHHLGKSQSERIVWLCEELNIPYELKIHDRDSVTMLSPPALKELHPLGAAPVMCDGDLVLAESAAIVEYIINIHGKGKLALGPGHKNYSDYLYWFHFSNGNLQPVFGRNMMLNRANLAPDNAILLSTQGRLTRVLNLLNDRLENNDYLAGQEFTAADIMSVFSLTTMRYFFHWDLSLYGNILKYLKRISDRPDYQRAMKKADLNMPLLLT